MIRYLWLPLLAAILLASGAAPAVAPVGASTASGAVQGDVNCDATVNAVDSLQILRSVAGLATSADCLPEAGDTDCDGTVTAVDSLRILRYVAGLSTTTPDSCIPIGEPLAPPPTSEELIAAALDAHDITYDESLLYRAYALYDLPGLPDQFRSPVIDYHAGRLLFVEIEENQALLSQATLDALAPIVARPNDPISIFNNPPVRVGFAAPQAAGVWDSTTSATGEVRVWIRTDWNSDADLSRYAQAATQVWHKLDAVFGLPIPDQVGNPPTGINPDNAIDIYFLPMNAVDPRMSDCVPHPNSPNCRLGTANGDTAPWGPRNGNTSSAYVKIQNTFSGDDLLRVIAHELAHTVQDKYDYNEDNWLSDSTADWVAFRVLQELGANKTKLYERANAIFQDPDKPLSRDEGWSRYGAWLYFFFASMDHGDVIVKSVWEKAAADGVQGIRAADGAIPFASNLDDFTVRNWNAKPPLVKAYKDKDGTFPDYAPKTKPWFFAWDEERTESDSISELASVYYRYTFNTPVRKVKFNNLIMGNPNAHLRALVKIGSVWKVPEDWTGKAEKVFCRDLPDENVTDLVIIVSNSDLTTPISAGNKLKVKTETNGCHGWLGTATGVSHYACCSTTVNATDGSQTLDTRTTANILWEEDPDFLFGCNCTAFFPTGTIDWSVDYRVESECCTCSDTDSGQVEAGAGLPDVTYQMMIRWDDPNDPDRYFYSGGGGVPVDAFINCDGGFTYPVMDFFNVHGPDIESHTPSPTPTPTPAPTPTATPIVAANGAAAANLCDEMEFTFPRDATTFSGSCYGNSDPNNYERFEWSFTRVDVVQP